MAPLYRGCCRGIGFLCWNAFFSSPNQCIILRTIILGCSVVKCACAEQLKIHCSSSAQVPPKAPARRGSGAFQIAEAILLVAGNGFCTIGTATVAFPSLSGGNNLVWGKTDFSLGLLGPLWLIRGLFPGPSALLEVENLLWGCWDSILTSQKAVDNSLIWGLFGPFWDAYYGLSPVPRLPRGLLTYFLHYSYGFGYLRAANPILDDFCLDTKLLGRFSGISGCDPPPPLA